MFFRFKELLINIDILECVELHDYGDFSIEFYMTSGKSYRVYFESESELKREFEKLHEILNSIEKTE